MPFLFAISSLNRNFVLPLQHSFIIEQYDENKLQASMDAGRHPFLRPYDSCRIFAACRSHDVIEPT